MGFLIRILVFKFIFLFFSFYNSSKAQNVLLEQYISVESISDKSCRDSVIKINAFASSGLKVKFSVISGSARISNDTVLITNIDFSNRRVQTSILIKASQEGNEVYNAATDEYVSFQIKTNFWDVFGEKPFFKVLKNNIYEGDTLMAIAESVPGANYKWTTPDQTQISEPSLIYVNAKTSLSGQYLLNVSEGECIFYNSRLDFKVSPIPLKKNQNILVETISDKSCNDSVFAIKASASSGLKVDFSVISGSARISNDTVLITNIDLSNRKVQTSILIKASQEGNEVYNAATDEYVSFQIKTNFWDEFGGKPFFNVLKTNIYEGDTLMAIAESVPGANYKWTTPDQTQISEPSLIYVNAKTSLSGQYLLNVSEGKCIFYNSRLDFKVSPIPLKKNQNILVETISDKSCNDSVFAIKASASSGLKVDFSVISGNASIRHDTVIIDNIDFTNRALWSAISIKASQKGNIEYLAANDTVFSFNIRSDFGVYFAQKPIFKKLDTLYYTGESILIEVETFVGATYHWHLPQNIMLDEPNVVLTNVETTLTGLYQLKIRDGVCQVLDTLIYITVKSSKEKEIKVYTIITPNDDGKNDVFFVENLEKYKENELIISDLWGNVVYNIANYSNNWSAHDVKEGEYYYRLKVQGKVYSGGFLILK